MGKKRYDLMIPEDTIKGLKVFITNKQEGQFKKGDISKWVGIAINNLTAGYDAHARSTHDANPYDIPKGQLKIKNMMQDICVEFVRSGIRSMPLSQGNTIVFKHLEKIIQNVTGHHDHRANKNHIKDLIRYEYIKDTGHIGTFFILDTGTNEEHVERIMEQQKQDGRNKKQEEKQTTKEFDTIMEDLK